VIGRLVRSLREDLTWGFVEWLASAVAGHWLMPRVLRRGLYCLLGLDVRTYGVSSQVTITGGWHLRIGQRTFVNHECYLEAIGGLSIGSDCLLAPQVSIFTSTHEVSGSGAFSPQPRHGPVAIGDRCWLGARSTVLPGVRIGDDVTVAAGAVVVRDCEVPGVYGGVPARLIRPRIPGPGAGVSVDPAVGMTVDG
jgi:maltose O-acetyltransferase